MAAYVEIVFDNSDGEITFFQCGIFCTYYLT